MSSDEEEFTALRERYHAEVANLMGMIRKEADGARAEREKATSDGTAINLAVSVSAAVLTQHALVASALKSMGDTKFAKSVRSSGASRLAAKAATGTARVAATVVARTGLKAAFAKVAARIAATSAAKLAAAVGKRAAAIGVKMMGSLLGGVATAAIACGSLINTAVEEGDFDDEAKGWVAGLCGLYVMYGVVETVGGPVGKALSIGMQLTADAICMAGTIWDSKEMKYDLISKETLAEFNSALYLMLEEVDVDPGAMAREKLWENHELLDAMETFAQSVRLEATARVAVEELESRRDALAASAYLPAVIAVGVLVAAVVLDAP